MALGTTNITMTAVRDALGESTLKLSELCLSTLINKWSKKKPVRGTFPQSSAGTYGLNLLDSSWDYLRPRGLSYNEGYRMGDFRGYEHDKSLAFPSIQCRQGDCTLRTIYPTGNTNYYNLWRARFFKDASDVIITPADFGLGSYYFGLKITNSIGTYYKTFGAVANVGSDGLQFIVDATLTSPESPAFNDLPYGSGTYSWRIVLCSSAASAWTETPPGIVIDFPTGVFSAYTLITSGTFTVANWISVSEDYYLFEEIPSVPETPLVLFASGGTFTINNPISSWCTVEVWNESMTFEYTAHPENWISGRRLKIYPSQNYGAQRSGTITVSANGASFGIQIVQEEHYVAPDVWSIETIGSWSVINTSWSFNGQNLTVSFTPQNLSPTSVPLYIAAYLNDEEIVETTTAGRDNYQTTKILDLGSTPPSSAHYKVYISEDPIQFIPE